MAFCRRWLPSFAMATLGMSSAAALAQDAPVVTPPAEPEAEETEELQTKWNRLVIGFTEYESDQLLSHYANPPEGLYLHELKLFRPSFDTSPYWDFALKGLPDDDFLADGLITLMKGHTQLKALRGEYEWYVFDWLPRDRSKSESTEVTVDHAFTPHFGGYFLYQLEKKEDNYPAPRDREKTRTEVVAGGGGGALLGGNLNVNAYQRRIEDKEGSRPETLQQSFNASYGREFGNSISLEGFAGMTEIDQSGLPSSEIRTLSLSGSWDLDPQTMLQFQLTGQELDLDTIQNAYVRERFLTSVRLVKRMADWSLQVGYKHKEAERYRADQSFVDVPEVDEYQARLSGKLGPARVTLRGTWQDLKESAVMQTDDTRQLLWDDRAQLQAKATMGTDTWTGYAAYTFKFQQNKARDVEINWHNFTVGGSYVFNPIASGFIEYSQDNYDVEGSFEDGVELEDYFLESRTLGIGLSWVFDPQYSGSISLNSYQTGDFNGYQLSLSMRKEISKDYAFEFVISPWRHEDENFGATDYQTTFLIARYEMKF